MDGVLSDFNQRYKEIFKQKALSTRERGEKHDDKWNQFVEGKNFETLDWYPGGKELLSFIKKYPVDVEILSSSGGEKFHGEVTVQKIKWLRSHGINYKANIVPGRKHKKDYATPEMILIDDTPDVIESFNKAGGHGILHKDISKTKEMLKKLLASSLNK